MKKYLLAEKQKGLANLPQKANQSKINKSISENEVKSNA